MTPLLILLLTLSGCGQRGDVDIDFASAVGDLTRVPAFAGDRPTGVSNMESSYDRTGGNMDWANLREHWIGDDDYMLADLRGPGCLRRIWVTNVRAEEWRFYFDNERRPRLRIAESNLFAIGQGGQFPFEPPLADNISGGAFIYVPLPYQTRLRIVIRNPYAAADARPYFHINYETYAPDTRVTTFPRRLSDRDREAVRQAQAAWTANTSTLHEFAERTDWQSARIEPNTAHSVFEASDTGGIIDTIAIRLDLTNALDAVQRAHTLRHLVLTAEWDGSDQTSIEVPLGDFFCNGLHARRFSALTLANIDGVYICRFPMPFRSGATLRLRNDGPFAVPLASAVDWTPGDPPDGMRYFHASWRSDLSPGRPFRIMRTEGRGVFLGTYMLALGMEQGWNILEGDEFFYRDGNWQPVHHGTGLEDYFNGGWYYYGLYDQPLHGLTEKAAMRTAQYRLQIPDPVTFERSLDAQIEFGDGNRSRGYKSASAYWYQDTPGPAGAELPPADQRFPPMEQVGIAAIMSELFELERMGLDLELEERCAYYAKLFEGQPLSEMMNLRRLAYREIREGAEAVWDDYQTIANDPETFTDVANQARQLLWRSEHPHRALFGGSGYATFRLFVNGQPVGQGGDPFTYQAFPVQLPPGRHLLQAEVTSRGDHSWYTLAYFSDYTNVVSDTTWDYSLEQPANWPAGTGSAALWQPYARHPSMFPQMQWWQFTPNAYVTVQSGLQVGGPFAGWEQPAGRTIYLRRVIDVPETTVKRHNPFIRRDVFRRTAPIRPEYDTSNEHLPRQL